VKLSANPLDIPKTAQACLQFEIPDNGFLPSALGLDAEMGLAVRVKR
jgi:hypothetical protein